MRLPIRTADPAEALRELELAALAHVVGQQLAQHVTPQLAALEARLLELEAAEERRAGERQARAALDARRIARRSWLLTAVQTAAALAAVVVAVRWP